MLPEALQGLLVLQDRDRRRVQLEKILAQAPRERTAIEARIAGHHEQVRLAKEAVTNLELKRKELEATIRGYEEQVLRYRSQQLLVKKNDEYQALTHEIEQTEAHAGEAEEQEIRILYDLDTERERAKQAEQAAAEGIASETTQMARAVERERQVQEELRAARQEVEMARAAVSPALLARYDRLVLNVGLPAVVPLQDHKCGGCHLKVSAGVDSEARKGGEIVSCDNCGRILLFEF